ncbi:MAG: hypothetical protein US42_C0010G0025 [Candidatus Magasanikbacteria bacterium GW2011_GWC2_37_14]|uniref:Integral membrane protein CcmA involved in cell shape determination n=1 Tax=Candidatus Magasanikbacteria bacterium GW2011_GWC2_37_14 TaxID=1619046 RepID=A0A0G0G8G8_9BACT|nr:MAG: hypothetical protein US42_C0010G0025 [Candidatus Magasanikbacteria bacterium GW2011_GWC2_37_14]
MFKKNTYESPVLNTELDNKTADEVETVVGPSVNVEGDFSSEGNIIVKGTVSGSVKTSKMLVVEKGAQIFANVRAGNAIISGSIKGNVKVSDRLELSETAQIAGDIDCKILSVAPGALLQGKVSMKGIEGEEDKKVSNLRIRNKVEVQEPVNLE